jgi:hypothetical protein
MVKSRLKILFCLTISLSFLLVPFALDIFPDGNAYGMGKRGSDTDHTPQIQPTSTSWTNYEALDEEGNNGANHNGPPYSIPELMILLIVGAGIGGLLILRKKLKKIRFLD